MGYSTQRTSRRIEAAAALHSHRVCAQQPCLAFCHLLHYYDPKCINLGPLTPETPLENLQLAFEVAEEQFHVPPLLDRRI